MSNLRISGFNSGLDIDSMVTQLMKAERSKLDKLKQSQTTITWQQEQFRDVSTSLVDFRNNKLSKYNTVNVLNARTSTVSGNTNAVSISSTNSNAAGSLTVTVDKLAESAMFVRQTGVTSVNATTKMQDILNGSTPSELKFTVSGKADPIVIAFNPTDLASDVLNKINSNKDLNVTGMLGSDGRLSIRSNETGARTVSLDAGILSGSSTGSDAEATVNGVKMTSKTNSLSVNGFNLELKAVTGTNGATTVSSKMDTDAIFNTIKTFIADYNTILDQVNGKLSEAKYRTYKPLTEDQKSEMKEKEIELWEKKATSGLLKNDSILSSMVSDMRMSLVSEVNTGSSAIKTIQSIGIVTGQWGDKGKLVIEDEQRLRAAIESNPSEVLALFNSKPSTAIPSGTPVSSNPGVGVFERLSSIAMNSLQLLSEKAGTSVYSTDKNSTFMANSLLGEQMRGLDRKISDMNSYLARKETQYYKQFTAMETAINRYSSQSSSFSSFQ
ncbi:flagellar filament capping protein FliD [Paenibacillus herberti]|uniref:Flagellar hook-associated protein 2 n=1 Tax=Paenibacillus herberti TaxID=1619309 RepID=A0A229NWL4_9BACL|nr:flagellar filament capping protein FliD [Paenibacillus herberti]OXM14125.1 flagellar cap protein FliD [Paenibacillus herberti]